LSALLVAVLFFGLIGFGWRMLRLRASAHANDPVAEGASSSTRPASSFQPSNAVPVRKLADSEREYLWQVEHGGLLLGQIAFQPLADALKQADRARLAALLADDFQGLVPSHPRQVRFRSDVATVERDHDDGRPPLVLGPDQFIARLLEYRGLFAGRPQVKVSLMSLGSERRPHLDGFWRGTCLLRLWGETAAGKPAEVTLILGYRLPKPDESAYAAGRWLQECGLRQSQVARSERYLMKEVAKPRGLDSGRLHDNWLHHDRTPLSNTGGVYLCDFDRDGRLDVLVADLNGYFFFRGLDGGRFEDVTAQVGLPRQRRGATTTDAPTAAFADLDGDGWEDVLLGNSAFRNINGRKFEMVAPSELGLRLPDGNAAIALADFDRDGRIDIYVARSSISTSNSWLVGLGNAATCQLWHNEGNWQFRNVTRESGTDGGGRSVFTALWLDVNDDRWPDLYVPNEFGDGLLLINRHDGTFANSTLVDRPCDFGTMGATCGDVDNDGRIDLYAANMYSKAGSRIIGNLPDGSYPESILAKMRRFVTGSQLHHNLGNLKFEQLGEKDQIAAVGWSYGPALADLNNDGWLDLFATCGYISQDPSKPDG
jgi:hypothetical protein